MLIRNADAGFKPDAIDDSYCLLRSIITVAVVAEAGHNVLHFV